MEPQGGADNVENEVDARDTNEWIRAAGQSFGIGEAPARYRCECSAPNCRSTVTLTRATYELTRKNGRQFVISIDHENPELEYVIWQGEGYAIVEMLPGRPSRVARDTDPRIGQPASR